MSRRRRVQCGSRGCQMITDSWKWPKTNDGLLFPAPRANGKPRKKDVVCHLICKIRKTFVPPPGCNLVLQSIRSHSGRHRMINDMKASEASCETAMGFARIRDKKTYDGYGKLEDSQVGNALEKNNRLKKELKKLYKG